MATVGVDPLGEGLVVEDGRARVRIPWAEVSTVTGQMFALSLARALVGSAEEANPQPASATGGRAN